MNHRPAMHIYQSPGDILELSSQPVLSGGQLRLMKQQTYELEPVCFAMSHDVLADGSIYHPLRYHRKLVVVHRHSYQWHHVRVTKVFPCHDLLAELLQQDYCQLAKVGTTP